MDNRKDYTEIEELLKSSADSVEMQDYSVRKKAVESRLDLSGKNEGQSENQRSDVLAVRRKKFPIIIAWLLVFVLGASIVLPLIMTLRGEPDTFYFNINSLYEESGQSGSEGIVKPDGGTPAPDGDAGQSGSGGKGDKGDSGADGGNMGTAGSNDSFQSDSSLRIYYTNENYYQTSMSKAQIQPVDLSGMTVKNYVVIKPSNGKAVGGAMNVTDEAETFTANVSFFTPNVSVSGSVYNSLNLSYVVGDKEIDYKLDDTQNENVYYAKLTYEDLTYYIKYVTTNGDITNFFDEVFI